ncbi:FGGY family carbohydrate kinase [Niveispirillum sp. KHB5.9]|uniref:FGGY family carbohydrate kinase n=1 Tax=Niveispirillum sp. KHB5.9 TaxID=3400269 RepID=UPI003A88991A
MPELLLALDCGTTGARALLADPAGTVLAGAKQAIPSAFPAPGRVEQDGEQVWAICRSVIARALEQAGRHMRDVAGIGVTTQRSSTVMWDRATGRPVAPVLVWSDLRGMDRYKQLRAAGFTLWPQVPAAKLEAALDLVPDGRARMGQGELCWGTLDSYLIHRLTGGGAHVTDIGSAWLSGYIGYPDHAGWNPALIAHQGLDAGLFPDITDSWGPIGTSDPALFDVSVPVAAVMADQQAGMLAHGDLSSGAWKATYGTSGVVMASTGDTPISPHRTVPIQAMTRLDGAVSWCVEGMVITCGAFLTWLCQEMGMFANAAVLSAAAASVSDTRGVVVRPSLQGLGAPHGRFHERALISGLDAGAGRAHVARAALQGIALRFREIAHTVAATPGLTVPGHLPVDGGVSASDPLLQLQADALGMPVRRHKVKEATAYGAAIAAGLGVGLLGPGDLPRFAQYDAEFLPQVGTDEAEAAYQAWARVALA